MNFVQTDVTDWSSLTNAFKSAINYSNTNSIDCVVAVAGLFGAPFDLPNEEPASLNKDPPQPPTAGAVFDVNVKGVYYTAKLAQHYFGLKSTSGDQLEGRKSFIVMGSLAGYMEFPQVADYPTSKWAVRGLFRAIRAPMERQGYRVNLIAPWIMDTPMSKDFCDLFRSQDIPVGNPNDVVTAVLRCATDDSISGKYFLTNPRCICQATPLLMHVSSGRALAVGAAETFDLQDDPEGGNSSPVVKEYLATEGKKFVEFFHLG